MTGIVLSSRVSDDLAAEVDRIAIANGMTRASFIEDTLKRAVLNEAYEALPLTPVQERGHPDDYVQIKVRLHHREVEAIDEVAEPLGLTRAEWIKRTIRWRLWDRAGVLRLAPTTRTEIGKVRKELLRIGRNVNQAVHAMNAANLPGSALQIDRIAEQFLHESRELSSALSETRRVVSRSVGAEVGYWASAYERSKT